MDTKSKPTVILKAYIKWLQAENKRKDVQIAALHEQLKQYRVRHGTQEG